MSKTANTRDPSASFGLLLLSLTLGSATACSPDVPSQQVLRAADSGSWMPFAGFSPDGQRLVWGGFEGSTNEADTTIFEWVKKPTGWQPQSSFTVLDAGWVASVFTTPDSLIVGAPYSVDPSTNGMAFQYRRGASGWELDSLAPTHGRMISVSDDGQILSSQSGVARRNGAQWRLETTVPGVISGDGTHLVMTSNSGGTELGYGQDFVMETWVFDGGAWVQESRFTWTMGALGAVYPPAVSRDGRMVAVGYSVLVRPDGVTATNVLLLELVEGQWELRKTLTGGPFVFSRVQLSADGQTLAVDGPGSVRVFEAAHQWQERDAGAGWLAAFSPDGTSLVTTDFASDHVTLSVHNR